MIETKAISHLKGNPQSSDHKLDFWRDLTWHSFTEQTQQFLCTGNTLLKGPGTKKRKKAQINAIMHQSWRNLTLREVDMETSAKRGTGETEDLVSLF